VLKLPYRVLNPSLSGSSACLVMMLMTPPKASLPKSDDEGPLTISMRSMLATVKRVSSSVPAVLPITGSPSMRISV